MKIVIFEVQTEYPLVLIFMRKYNPGSDELNRQRDKQVRSMQKFKSIGKLENWVKNIRSEKIKNVTKMLFRYIELIRINLAWT